ncbi:cobalamin biosynthesis protein CbiG [Synechococcales cyanobacterium C]|uniref:Cobalamin biosynthesis protein CbiG n=1 Tax=Petrachloros mirabilis ULC683 TaxID=2781853 RepID=A0A8K1ZWT3_9CYAN|nr:cobalamin biosynthesis protein [Petrachloros mirabilis]NCJ05563.1 cobalamin biosynthesis protein CbiG [Petrachloros mirabilis ULC683]
MPSRALWVGLGFQKGMPATALLQGVQQVFRVYALDWDAIAGIATLAHKTCEPSLVNLCQQQQWQLLSFSAPQLKTVSVPHSSRRVATAMGTPSVAEAACLLATHQGQLIVPKQILQTPFGAMTTAVAEINSLG